MWDRCFAQDFVSVVTCGMGYKGYVRSSGGKCGPCDVVCAPGAVGCRCEGGAACTLIPSTPAPFRSILFFIPRTSDVRSLGWNQGLRWFQNLKSEIMTTVVKNAGCKMRLDKADLPHCFEVGQVVKPS